MIMETKWGNYRDKNGAYAFTADGLVSLLDLSIWTSSTHSVWCSRQAIQKVGNKKQTDQCNDRAMLAAHPRHHWRPQSSVKVCIYLNLGAPCSSSNCSKSELQISCGRGVEECETINVNELWVQCREGINISKKCYFRWVDVGTFAITWRERQ